MCVCVCAEFFKFNCRKSSTSFVSSFFRIAHGRLPARGIAGLCCLICIVKMEGLYLDLTPVWRYTGRSITGRTSWITSHFPQKRHVTTQ